MTIDELHRIFEWNDEKNHQHTFFDNQRDDFFGNSYAEIYFWANCAIPFHPYLYHDNGKKIPHPGNQYPKIATSELILFAVSKETNAFFSPELYFRSIKTGLFYLMKSNIRGLDYDDENDNKGVDYPYPFVEELTISEDDVHLWIAPGVKDRFKSERRKYKITLI